MTRNFGNSVTLRLEDSTRNKTQKNRRKSPVAVVSSRLPPGYRPYRQALLAGQPQLLSSFTAVGAVLSLRWIELSSRLSLRPLAGDRSSSRLPSTTIGPSAAAALAFGPSSRDFQPPLHACLGHLRLLRSFRRRRTEPASRVVRLSFRECRVVSVVGSVRSDILGCAFVVGKLIVWMGREKINSSRGTLPGVLGWGIQAQGKRPPGSVNQLGQYWKQKQNP